MKVLSIKALSNIKEMKRRDIVKVIADIYIPPNYASKIRLELALKKGRNVKTLIKYLGFVDRYSHSDKTSNDKYAIGEKYPFVTCRGGRNGYNFSQRYGEVWAISGKATAIIYNGDLQLMEG